EAEREDAAPLVLAQDAREGADEEERHDGDDDEQERFHVDHATPPLTSAFAASASVFATRSVSPSTATIRTCAPGSSAPPSATARGAGRRRPAEPPPPRGDHEQEEPGRGGDRRADHPPGHAEADLRRVEQ